VAEHYASLSVEELLADVLRHYRGMWPGIEAMIASHASDASTDPLILEGSALWPESVATLACASVGAIWLTASDDLFRARIHGLSRFAAASDRERELIQKFLQRTCLYNERMMAAVRRLGLASIDVETTSSLEELRDALLERMPRPGSDPVA
jgi:hypothetical protein